MAAQKLKSLKDIQKEYLDSESKLARVGVLVGGVFQSLFMLVFGALFGGMPLLFFVVPMLTAEDFSFEKGKLLALGLVGIFVIVGFALAGFGIYRIVKIIHIIRANPLGKFAESGNAASANPFENAVQERNAENDPADTPAAVFSTGSVSTKGFVGFVLFGFVFFCIGVFVSGIGVKRYLQNQDAAENWISVPCTIVSAKIETNHSSKGGTTYEPKIRYKYTHAGMEYFGDKLGFISPWNTDDYSREERRLEEYKATKTCWVNPDVPAESILLKPSSEFSFSKISVIIFGIPFMLFGGIIAAGTFHAKFKKPQKRVRLAPGQLQLISKKGEAISKIVFSVLWNSILSAFICFAISDSRWSLWLFLVPFIAAGIGTAVMAIRCILSFFAPHYEVKISPAHGIVPAGTYQIEWDLVDGDPSRFEFLKIEFCYVKVKTGHDDRVAEKLISAMPVFETTARTTIGAGTCEFTAPEELGAGFFRLRFTAGTRTIFRRKIKDYYKLKRA